MNMTQIGTMWLFTFKNSKVPFFESEISCPKNLFLEPFLYFETTKKLKF